MKAILAGLGERRVRASAMQKFRKRIPSDLLELKSCQSDEH